MLSVASFTKLFMSNRFEGQVEGVWIKQIITLMLVSDQACSQDDLNYQFWSQLFVMVLSPMFFLL